MNLYETEALTFDPESRRGESTAADVFFSIFFCSLHVWVDKCAWCLFLWRVSLSYGKRKTSKEKKTHQAALLYPFHVWTRGSPSVPGGTSHEHFDMDQVMRGKGRKGNYWRLFPVGLPFRKWLTLGTTTPLYPGRTSSRAGRTIQPFLYKMSAFSFLTPLICTSRLCLRRTCTAAEVVDGRHTSIAIGWHFRH